MNLNDNLKGIFAPVTTPFAYSGKIDLEGLYHNLSFYCNSRLKGVLILGSNSEYKSLSEVEKYEVLQKCVEKLAGKKTLIIGLMYESLYLAKKFIAKISEFPVNYLLVQPPYYFKKDLTESDYISYFENLARVTPFPLLIYNAPAFTGIDFSEKLICQLSEVKQIIGIKEGSKINKKYPEKFAVLTGTISTLLEKLQNGAVGGVVSFANFLPELPTKIYENYSSGNKEEAEKFQIIAKELNDLISGKHGVAGVKAAMDLVGLSGGWPRLPLKKLPAAQIEAIDNRIKKLYDDVR